MWYFARASDFLVQYQKKKCQDTKKAEGKVAFYEWSKHFSAILGQNIKRLKVRWYIVSVSNSSVDKTYISGEENKLKATLKQKKI